MAKIVTKTDVHIKFPFYSSANPHTVVKHFSDRSYEITLMSNGMATGIKLLGCIENFILNDFEEISRPEKQAELELKFKNFLQESLKQISA